MTWTSENYLYFICKELSAFSYNLSLSENGKESTGDWLRTFSFLKIITIVYIIYIVCISSWTRKKNQSSFEWTWLVLYWCFLTFKLIIWKKDKMYLQTLLSVSCSDLWLIYLILFSFINNLPCMLMIKKKDGKLHQPKCTFKIKDPGNLKYLTNLLFRQCRYLKITEN